MDGVLCDFEGRVEEISGKSFESLTRQEIWDTIKEDEYFYLTLPWTDDGEKLWQYLVTNYEPIILSASSSHVARSTQHKYMWCELYLELYSESVIVVPHKSTKAEFAVDITDGLPPHPNILIDDNEINIKQWRDAGGIGILYTTAGEAIKQLKLLEMEGETDVI